MSYAVQESASSKLGLCAVEKWKARRRRTCEGGVQSLCRKLYFRCKMIEDQTATKEEGALG